MANLSAESLGLPLDEPEWGDAFIDKDAGKGPENDLYLDVAGDFNLVTEDELNLYIDHNATRDVEFRNITFPPDVEVTLRLANEFYDTYLADTDIDKVDAIDRYCVALIEKVVAQAKKDAEQNPSLAPVIEEALDEFEQEVVEYVRVVHNAAAEQEDLELAA